MRRKSCGAGSESFQIPRERCKSLHWTDKPAIILPHGRNGKLTVFHTRAKWLGDSTTRSHSGSAQFVELTARQRSPGYVIASDAAIGCSDEQPGGKPSSGAISLPSKKGKVTR